MGPTITRVPAVVDAVVTGLRGALGVQVTDGPSTEQIEDEVITIGLGDENTVVGYESTQTRAQGLGRRATETFTIHCWLSVRSGDTGDGAVKACRDRALELLTAVRDVLETAPVRGTCDAIDLGAPLAWLPVQNAKGAACGLSFDITGSTLL